MTFNVVCETDASAGRAMATRRGVGRVRHLDARLWLQQLCAESVFQVRARPGEHNEADLETKICRFQMIDLAFERKTPSTANGLELMDGGDDSLKDCRVLVRNVRNMCETSGWFWICGNGHCDPDGAVGRTAC